MTRRIFSGRFLLVTCLALCSGIAAGSGERTAGDGFVLTQWGRWTHEQAITALDQAKRAGASHVSLLAMLCQKDLKASEIRWCESEAGVSLNDSEQGTRLRRLMPEFTRRGLKASLIPFPMVEDHSPRAGIRPDDRDAWFENYATLMEQLSAFASEFGIDELVVASELTRLFWLEAPWRDLIRRLRAGYAGHLTISPVAVQYPLIRFWDELDSIGLSAYFPLTFHPKLSSVKWLENNWRAHKIHLKSFAKKHSKPLTFVEVGYPTTHVAPMMPWDFQWQKRKLDELSPARCWEAFRRVWSGESSLRSFRIWGLSGQPETPKAFSPIGKLAETPVRLLFQERAALQD